MKDSLLVDSFNGKCSGLRQTDGQLSGLGKGVSHLPAASMETEVFLHLTMGVFAPSYFKK